MALPIIVSVVHRDQGRETLSHFALIEGSLIRERECSGCGTHLWDRLAPVELSDGGQVEKDEAWGAPLCRSCSPRTGLRIGASWPGGMTTVDIASLWRQVTAEQASECERELQGYRAAALEETQRAFAATKESPVDQGVDGALEVA